MTKRQTRKTLARGATGPGMRDVSAKHVIQLPSCLNKQTGNFRCSRSCRGGEKKGLLCACAGTGLHSKLQIHFSGLTKEGCTEDEVAKQGHRAQQPCLPSF